MNEGEREQLKRTLGPRAYEVYKRADVFSEQRLQACREVVDAYLKSRHLPIEDICVIAVGSVGRREALEASDLDLVPILRLPTAGFEEHDAALRDEVRRQLGTKVSNGEQLTKFQTVDELTAVETIGGDEDDSPALTRRTLILTEGSMAGGAYDLGEVRRRVLAAYSDAERSRGRHVLSLCNDVARYYRTLCIEYQAKIDTTGKDWCTRNLKLRHSRKLWYFSTMLALARVSHEGGQSRELHVEKMLEAFERPPHLRLLGALGAEAAYPARAVLECYAWFLEFMAVPANRQSLANVTHEARYAVSPDNPFPAMKINSDLMHREMIRILDSVDRALRDRVLDWFLL